MCYRILGIFNGRSPTYSRHTLGGLIVATGTVKWFDATKGYGFIQPEDGTEDTFVHLSAVKRAGLETLLEGQKVEYELVEGRRGRMAADNLKLVR